MEVIAGLIWFGFWVWVLKGIYRWLTGGIGRALSGNWGTMLGVGEPGAPVLQRSYHPHFVQNPPAAGKGGAVIAAGPLGAATSDLEATLRAEESSATELARTIGDHRRAAAADRKSAAEWRQRAETAVSEQRDDLARKALAEAQRHDDAAGEADALIGQLQPILDSYEKEIEALRRQLDDGLRKKAVVDARMERARAGERAARWLTPEASARLTEIANAEERRADLAEAQVEVQKIGGFGRKGVAPPLPRALAAPETALTPDSIAPDTVRRWDAAIDRQLADLKARQGKSAA